MKTISHRGNLLGPMPLLENSEEYILDALHRGIECEIDVWYADDTYYLGHNGPMYKTSLQFLSQAGLWLHAKDLNTLNNIPSELNFFWHQQDDFTLTSKGYIWTFPGKSVCNKSVIVDKDRDWKYKGYKCHGVCTDWVF